VSKKILIVDDMTSVRMLVRMLLQGEQYQIDEAVNGKDALEKIGSGVPPDLVIMDVMMPEMNGIDCCREVHQRYPALPVVMLTTKGEESYVEMAKEAGASAYLTKPVRRIELLVKIKDLLK
jgi:CheY-like chemotaxis protein